MVDQMPQKKVFDFRKNTANYKLYKENEGKPIHEEQKIASSLLDITESGAVLFNNFDFEQRADSNLEPEDLLRLQREINHNRKKQLKAEQNRQKGLHPDGSPLVREADD